MKKSRSSRGLVTQSLEHISREIFIKYASLITQLVERSSGVYALYDEGELYYVGRATQLRTRVRQHLRDRHDASWTHFSLYLVSNDDHIGEIESLLIRIANPRGNTVKPKGRDSKLMKKRLENLIRLEHKKELREMFSSSAPKKTAAEGGPRDLKGLVSRRTPIYRTYKGKEHKAILTPAGSIIYKGKKFTTATAAAKMIVTTRAVNGWTFWNIRNDSNEWVKLNAFVR